MARRSPYTAAELTAKRDYERTIRNPQRAFGQLVGRLFVPHLFRLLAIASRRRANAVRLLRSRRRSDTQAGNRAPRPTPRTPDAHSPRA